MRNFDFDYGFARFDANPQALGKLIPTRRGKQGFGIKLSGCANATHQSEKLIVGNKWPYPLVSALQLGKLDGDIRQRDHMLFAVFHEKQYTEPWPSTGGEFSKKPSDFELYLAEKETQALVFRASCVSRCLEFFSLA
ncbi:hypothetical protein [Paraeggerthella sp. Marseille-Q4926]|uniref:hypothetical protein n=1 Tax=Paraeggerthella TaxID=651554 RepID=UPI001CE45D7A|nr:hypothetical protein [Paraeggerthella sp. Marseille-Q4926]